MAAAVKKKAAASIRLLINAGAAKPAPPVGPALGQAGLNIMAFCKEFNAKTADFRDDVPLRVNISVYADKSYDWTLKMPPASYFIKKAAGLARGAGRPGHESVAAVSLKHLYEIARAKAPDMPGVPLRSVVKTLMFQCSSMGVRVVARPEDA
ncbi:mitochondrial ribosomal protein L11 [Raphidocelis subcapitata]|uniref:Large ribosomal subunit protein uL11m n=1 Tax=Raphidocelis subcapitata TaxID=307507 RepID=A0A2V0PAJ8_9CHLO|nr:mitochondrial ribosomal protein L11 [Raphidocelis subcapitata]|eukprot:GBF96876.1 mitochondrial ribosomal protein L11 [Raphidocelis subcapitata]